LLTVSPCSCSVMDHYCQQLTLVSFFVSSSSSRIFIWHNENESHYTIFNISFFPCRFVQKTKEFDSVQFAYTDVCQNVSQQPEIPSICKILLVAAISNFCGEFLYFSQKLNCWSSSTDWMPC